MELNFPGSSLINAELFSNDTKDHLQEAHYFDFIINYIELSLLSFICITIRVYEDEIHTPKNISEKKIKYIRKILKEKFKAPSLGTILDLTRHCFHLIENNVLNPGNSELLKLKECLSKSFELDSISVLLNDLSDLQNLGKTDSNLKPRTIYNAKSKASFLNIIAPKIVEARNYVKHYRDFSILLEEAQNKISISKGSWKKAIIQITGRLSPITNHIFIKRSLGGPRDKHLPSINNKKIIEFTINKKVYRGNHIESSEETFQTSELNEIKDFSQNNSHSVILEENSNSIPINLFPFLIINDDKLYFYKNTRANGFEFFCLCDEHGLRK